MNSADVANAVNFEPLCGEDHAPCSVIPRPEAGDLPTGDQPYCNALRSLPHCVLRAVCCVLAALLLAAVRWLLPCAGVWDIEHCTGGDRWVCFYDTDHHPVGCPTCLPTPPSQHACSGALDPPLPSSARLPACPPTRPSLPLNPPSLCRLSIWTRTRPGGTVPRTPPASGPVPPAPLNATAG